ncbi:NADAR family protein [Actinomadura kijaniata]|uniref:NADAR family protein n=1 Tax=Actinomadura kijaniata TaxID=46161 RepID=UPI00082EA6C7|nr:NADAR family protein [Actinomadura kijaniata]
MPLDRTYRVVDGERIEGVLRPVFVRNGDYYLTNMAIFADGAIDCWGWTDLDGLRGKLESGWIATELEPDGRASVHHLASWRFAEPATAVSAEDLLGEVADVIEELNGRPTSAERCLEAVSRYLETRREEDRLALRAAYEAIPSHQRVYVLGDMDHRDVPLRLLVAGIGDVCDDYTTYELEYADDAMTRDGHLVVTEQVRQWALDYFAEYGVPGFRRREPRETTTSPTVVLNYGKPMYPESHGLRNEFPAPITVDGTTYPTVEHAYWALSTTDEALAERVRAGDSAAARDLAAEGPSRPGWDDVRLAVMTELLRTKFDQHPDLADVLLATGDGRIHYASAPSPFWGTGEEGRNWIGRLLELVRSELQARRHGL